MRQRRHFKSWLRYIRGCTPWESDLAKPQMLTFLKNSGLMPGKVLDLGCGSGANLVHMAALGWQGLGIDHVQIPIDRARKRADEAGVSGRIQLLKADVRDLANLPTDPPYDLVLDLGCSHTLLYEEYGTYIQTVGGLLREDGRYFLFAYERGEIGRGHLGIDPEFVIEAAQPILELVESHPGAHATRESNWYHFKRS